MIHYFVQNNYCFRKFIHYFQDFLELLQIDFLEDCIKLLEDNFFVFPENKCNIFAPMSIVQIFAFSKTALFFSKDFVFNLQANLSVLHFFCIFCQILTILNPGCSRAGRSKFWLQNFTVIFCFVFLCVTAGFWSNILHISVNQTHEIYRSTDFFLTIYNERNIQRSTKKS